MGHPWSPRCPWRVVLRRTHKYDPSFHSFCLLAPLSVFSLTPLLPLCFYNFMYQRRCTFISQTAPLQQDTWWRQSDALTPSQSGASKLFYFCLPSLLFFFFFFLFHIFFLLISFSDCNLQGVRDRDRNSNEGR